MRSVQEIGDELYALAPPDFTSARDGYVNEAKRTGERDAAAQLAALKRPTVSAWLVNLVALRRPESIASLIELGESIRTAQGGVSPAQLRDLSANRRKEIERIIGEAQALAASASVAAPTKQQLTEVESTLAAAMADDAAARLVRSGRVVKALAYTGFGAAATGIVAPARAGADLAGGRGGAGGGAVAGAGGGAAVGAPDAESRRAEAVARLEAARRAAAAASAAEGAAGDAVDRLVSEVAGARERLGAAQMQARAARQARIAAERDLSSAERRLAALDR